MLQRIKSSQLSQRAHFQDEKCSFCLDPVMQDQSFAHVNQDGKILHVVGCSLGCVQSIFQMYRKKNDDIKCPICCEKFTLQQISQYFIV